MRNLFALIGLVVVATGGTGWYLGWYKVNVTKNSDGNVQIQTNVDTNKVKGDSSEFFQKVSQMVGDKVHEASQNVATPPAAPASTPGTTNGSNLIPGTTQGMPPTPPAPPPPPFLPVVNQ
jgi:hypothetical protein